MTAWLLTWLWQGSVLTGAVALAMRWMPRRSAATTYAIWYVTLAALVWFGWPASPDQHLGTAMAAADPIYIPSAPKSVITGLVGAWTAIALVGLLRILPGLRSVFMIRDRCRPFPSTIETQLPLWLEQQGRGRLTELVICDSLRSAAVLGFHRPCIAIPPALVEALGVDELDQVILHEYAHVQRYDDWWRLAQTVLLSVLWIHPAALFASRALNREREMACDEWVVARTGRAKSYARCLAHAAEVTARMGRRSLLEPALLGSRPELIRRVERILSIDNPQRGVSLRALGAALCGIAACSLQLQTVGALSEIADVVFPQVRTEAARADMPDMTAVERIFVTVSAPVEKRRGEAPALDRFNDPARSDVASEPVVRDAAAAPQSGGVSAEISGRRFEGAYPLRDTSRSASSSPAPWKALAAPGLEVASAAKKTSIGIATAFSRAGVSVARSF
jgi:beta-lactamase regulating signal transducer with metallopeptidase domain